MAVAGISTQILASYSLIYKDHTDNVWKVEKCELEDQCVSTGEKLAGDYHEDEKKEIIDEVYLKVVSFDADWKEIYVGVARKDIFTAECPNNVPDAAKVAVKYQTKERENTIISTAKWCPMENCTLLVLGSQYGLQIYDWDGSNLVYEFDFLEAGIVGDEKQVRLPDNPWNKQVCY